MSDATIPLAKRRDPPPEERGDVVPALVHELRQPLSGLDAGLRLVARELGASVTALDGWRIATGQLARLRETLDRYQQLADPSCAEHAAFAVAPVVRRSVEELRFRLDALRDRFTLIVEDDVPQAWGSPPALHHAVTNLVANALDAVEEAGPTGRIEVRVLRVAGRVPRAQVRVADEGVGIPASRRSRLFRDGFTTKPAGKGNGIGLALARRLVRGAAGELRLAADDDPDRRRWSATELVVDLAASAASPAPQERPRPPASGLRDAAPGALLAAALLAAIALGWLGVKRWVGSAEMDPTSVAAAAIPDRVQVLEVEGQVERERAGGWEPVAIGQLLRVDDTLRTSSGAGATLAIGGRSRLAVSDATQLTVHEITAAMQRLRIARGRISVDHQPDGSRVVVVESERGDSIARAGAARFSVLASGTALAVATEAGVVRLQSGDRAVEVAAGRRSVSFRGQPPAQSTAIPAGLLLKIARRASGDGSCTVTGAVDPGSEVRVDGRPADVGQDGRFTVRVPGRATHATVWTRDVAGHAAQRRVACDGAEHDVSDFSVRWGRD
jgi:hypothetical protein